MLKNCSSIVSDYKENCTLSSPFSFKDTSFLTTTGWKTGFMTSALWLNYVFITYESKKAQNEQYLTFVAKMFNAKTKRCWTETVQGAVQDQSLRQI
jgi:hypothetical protein